MTWMDPETVILSEVKDKDKYHVLSLICGIFKKKKKKVQTNFFMKQKKSHRCGKQTSRYQGGKLVGGG